MRSVTYPETPSNDCESVCAHLVSIRSVTRAFPGGNVTRKDYVLLAAAIRSLADDSGDGLVSIDDVMAAIADVLAADNPRFNRDRFLKACR